jgi:hypothetical protein
MKVLSGPNKSENASQRQRLALTIRRLADALVAGDDGALAPLQRLSRLYPVAFADEIKGDVMERAHDALAHSWARNNKKLYTDMRVRLKLESDRLAGDNPSAAMQSCAAWVAIMQAHACIEAARVASSEKGGHLLEDVGRAYLRAVKTLAQIEALETRRPRRVRPKARTIDAQFKIIR